MNKIPARLKEWDGTKAERNEIIEERLEEIWGYNFPELKRRDFNRLFIEAFVRNVIQSQLLDMMHHIMEEIKEG